jgi:hypothetical protein
MQELIEAREIVVRPTFRERMHRSTSAVSVAFEDAHAAAAAEGGGAA